MIILGIETSCDDTGISLIERKGKNFKILSNIISSQTKIHSTYGGVVPNLAAREHLKNIDLCLKKSFQEAGSSFNKDKIDLIAVTVGPGLIPSLLVGVSFAKALAYKWQKKIIGINHIEGHIYANWLNNSKIEFPVLCLVVSGGHTQLILMKNHGKYELLGETLDDAVGEAFDKVAKLLNLGYPGGPIISQRAKKGDPKYFKLPKPMIDRKNFDFSFSGLKTAVLYEFKKCDKKDINNQYVNNMAASFQQTAIDVLIYKTIKAAKKYQVKNILLSGGVAANQELRNQLKENIKKELENINFHMPEIKLCTDNAAMICAAAFYYKNKKQISSKNCFNLKADSNLKLFT